MTCVSRIWKLRIRCWWITKQTFHVTQESDVSEISHTGYKEVSVQPQDHPHKAESLSKTQSISSVFMHICKEADVYRIITKPKIEYLVHGF